MNRLATILLLFALLGACGGTTGTPDNGNAPPDDDDNPPPTEDTVAPEHNTIAYVTGDGDAIRLIDPDGANDRPLWSHGLGDPEGVREIWSMRWNPAATHLAFASTHENHCSLFTSDIFAVGADGSDYRRITQAPACEDLDAYPTGTVQVPVVNSSFDSFSGFLYFQGAPSAQPVNLPPNGSTVVTFTDVADFADGSDGLQVATVIVGVNREILFSTAIDVVAGGTVTTSEATIYTPSGYWEMRAPTWHASGSDVGFVLNFNSLWELPARPSPLAFGDAILAADATPPDFVDHLAWGPTTATADQLLYAGTETFDSLGIYLATEGGSAGTPLVSWDSTESVNGLAWLPDGSGFVYAVTEGAYFGDDRSSNLFHYDLGTDTVQRITDFVGDFAAQPRVSPDGQRVVFEGSAEAESGGSVLIDPDLWLVDIDGSGLELLVSDARAPAWSW